MKKIIFVVLAIGILVSFTGCDWFRGIFNIGSVELKVDSVYIAQINGMLSSIQISIENYGDNDADSVEYTVVFSTDEVIDIFDDTTIYEETVYIEREDWFDRTVLWNEIESYLISNFVTVPVLEGYIGVIVDPYDNYDEDDGTWDNSAHDFITTAVPSYDEWEPDDSSGSANALVAGGLTPSHALFPSGDDDWFSFYADDFYSYDIVTSAMGDVYSDTFITIYDDTLTEVANDNDSYGNGLAALFGWGPPADGTYYIKVHEYDGNAGMYQISLDEYP